MDIVVWTHHPLVCQKLMDKYCKLFVQKPFADAMDGSLIWYKFPDDTLRPFWEQWIQAALFLGLIYDGKIT